MFSASPARLLPLWLLHLCVKWTIYLWLNWMCCTARFPGWGKKKKERKAAKLCVPVLSSPQPTADMMQGEWGWGHRSQTRLQKVIQPLCPGAGPKINATHRLGDGEHHHKWSLRPWKEQGIIWRMSFLWRQCNIPFFSFLAREQEKRFLWAYFTSAHLNSAELFAMPLK